MKNLIDDEQEGKSHRRVSESEGESEGMRVRG